MQATPWYFAHASSFVIPAEYQTDAGLDPAFAEALLADNRVDEAWIARLSRALLEYRRRIDGLFDRARAGWFPWRRQNICIASDEAAVRPYLQPFDRASWPLYLADFDPSTSSLELSVFLLAHVERLGLIRRLAPTLISELPWFLDLDDAARADFCAGCARSTRPDAAAMRAIAEAMPWIVELHHDALAPKPPGAMIDVGVDGLLVPEAHGPAMLDLVARVEECSRAAFLRWRELQRAPLRPTPPRPGPWLCDARPRVRIVDREGAILWDHVEPDACEAIEAALSSVADIPLASLYADFTAIDRVSNAVLAGLVDTSRLPDHASEVETRGGIWLDPRAKTIVYSLGQPGFDVLLEPAPPYHRLLLEARVAHEWGHLAADAGIVRVPASSIAVEAGARSRLAAVLAEIVERCPPAERLAAARQLGSVDVVPALVHIATGRLGDYMANLFARRFLGAAALEAYVRNNVRTLAHESGWCLLTRLVRHAYEFQYLRFSAMPAAEDVFFATTWFDPNFVATGIVTRCQATELFAVMAEICACHVVDDAALVT